MTTNAPAEAFASALGALLFSASDDSNTRPTLVVAYSGGRDSTVLLHLAFAYAQAHQLALRAIHINHQLQAAASEFVQHCQRECQALNIPLEICTVTVTRRDKGLEADARAARYAALAERLHRNDILLLGQHADDQLETLLLQLLRGAGPSGLAGMPATAEFAAGQLCRPLLGLRREQLTALAIQRGWRWVDDPSNDDHSLARNRLRHELMPVLLAQRAGAAEVLLRAMQWQVEAVALQADLAALDAASAMHRNGLLSRAKLLQLSGHRQANLLRWWLQQQQLPSPNAERLQSFLRQLASGSEQVLMRWGAWQLRIAAGQLLVLPDWDASQLTAQIWPAPSPQSAPNTFTLPLGLGVLQLHAASAMSASARNSAMPISSQQGLRAPRKNEIVSLRWQTPGLRVQWPGRQGRRELKDVFQETGVPAWLRPFWPKLFYNDELVALPGLLICQDGVAEPTVKEPQALATLHVDGPLFSLHQRLQTPDVAFAPATDPL